MKILLAYNCTTRLRPRFEFCQEIQRKLFPGVSEYDRLLVSDHPMEVSGFHNVTCDRYFVEGNPCVSTARNVGLKHAGIGGYDFCVLMDLDAVLLEKVIPYEDAFTLTWTFHTNQQENKSGQFDLADEARWSGCGFFILPRIAFGCSWCEDFKGQQYEDIDYHHNVLVPAGIRSRPWQTNAMHVWHEPRGGWNEANFILLAARLALNHLDISKMDGWGDPVLLDAVRTIRRLCNHERALRQFLPRAAQIEFPKLDDRKTKP